MSNTLSSVSQVLCALWHRHRNLRHLQLALAAAAAAAAAPGWLLVMSLREPRMLVPATIAAAMALCVVMLVLWMVVASGVLDQNLPSAARLVPSHPRRLRVALLAAWTAFMALAIGTVGPLTHQPLLVAFGAAAVLGVVAAATRWRAIWIALCFVPTAIGAVVHEAWFVPIEAAALAPWHAAPALVTVLAIAASAAIVASVIQMGGARHARDYEARQARKARMRLRTSGVEQQALCGGANGWLARLRAAPYHWWLQRTIARPSPSTMPRVMLMFGPSAHWTTLLANVVLTTAMLVSVLALFAMVTAGSSWVDLIGGFAIGVMFPFAAPALQAQSRLYQTRREQALLMLLPGVPRGTSLNRALSLRLTGHFVLVWLVGVALVVIASLASKLLQPPGAVSTFGGFGDFTLFVAISLLPPLAPTVWRQWSRMGAPTQLSMTMALVVSMLCTLGAFALQRSGAVSTGQVVVAYVAVALGWCGLRWHRMGHEPSAFPVGRLHA